MDHHPCILPVHQLAERIKTDPQHSLQDQPTNMLLACMGLCNRLELAAEVGILPVLLKEILGRELDPLEKACLYSAPFGAPDIEDINSHRFERASLWVEHLNPVLILKQRMQGHYLYPSVASMAARKVRDHNGLAEMPFLYHLRELITPAHKAQCPEEAAYVDDVFSHVVTEPAPKRGLSI